MPQILCHSLMILKLPVSVKSNPLTERRDKTYDGGVLDVITVGGSGGRWKFLIVFHPICSSRGRNLIRLSRKPDKALIEKRHVIIQHFRCISARIHADEQHLHTRLLLGREKFVSRGQICQDRRADIRTIRKTESDQDKLSAQAA